jgi:hypothetical protein
MLVWKRIFFKSEDSHRSIGLWCWCCTHELLCLVLRGSILMAGGVTLWGTPRVSSGGRTTTNVWQSCKHMP